MATPTTQTELLKSQATELIKSYSVYDGNSRPTSVYVAKTSAITGDSCILTTYTYTSGTSTLVQKRKESYDIWDASYDI